MKTIVLLIALTNNANGQDLPIAVYHSLEECRQTIVWMQEHSTNETAQLICEEQ